MVFRLPRTEGRLASRFGLGGSFGWLSSNSQSVSVGGISAFSSVPCQAAVSEDFALPRVRCEVLLE